MIGDRGEVEWAFQPGAAGRVSVVVERREADGPSAGEPVGIVGRRGEAADPGVHGEARVDVQVSEVCATQGIPVAAVVASGGGLGVRRPGRRVPGLLARPEEERPQWVVSSPLRRCRETAELTAEVLGAPLVVDDAVGEIPTPKMIAAAARPAWLQAAFEGTWRESEGDLDFGAWRRGVTRTLIRRGNTAVFSHFVAINAVVSSLTGDERVVCFRPDHTSITVLETDGDRVTLVARGSEPSTGVL